MKIVGVDNLDRDYVSDIHVAENVAPHMADLIVELLNNEASLDESSTFYKVVPDDYKLYKVEP